MDRFSYLLAGPEDSSGGPGQGIPSYPILGAESHICVFSTFADGLISPMVAVVGPSGIRFYEKKTNKIKG